MAPPVSLFSGVALCRALAPDNIVFFNRTNTEAFKPEGVSNNYHHRFELVVVVERSGPVRIGETSYLLEPREAALIFPNQFHHYMDIENDSMQWLFITFELENAEEIEALKDAPRILGRTELQILGQIMEAYLDPTNGVPDALQISYHLARLLRGMVKASEIREERRDIHSGNTVRDVILEKINAYVRSHLGEAPTIADLAAALDYSVSHLRTVFRTRLGVSLGKYIRESRLSQAATLLQSTQMSVSEVAQQSGFESLFVFSRAFKKAYGMPPKTYSKLTREGKLPLRKV